MILCQPKSTTAVYQGLTTVANSTRELIIPSKLGLIPYYWHKLYLDQQFHMILKTNAIVMNYNSVSFQFNNIGIHNSLLKLYLYLFCIADNI